MSKSVKGRMYAFCCWHLIDAEVRIKVRNDVSNTVRRTVDWNIGSEIRRQVASKIGLPWYK